MSFWGSTAEFYNHRLIDACEAAMAEAANDANADQAVRDWFADLDQNGHTLLPPSVDLSAHESERVECNQVVIRHSLLGGLPQFEVTWTAIPKHSDVDVATNELPLAALEAYLKQTAKAPA